MANESSPAKVCTGIVHIMWNVSDCVILEGAKQPGERRTLRYASYVPNRFRHRWLEPP